MAPKGPEVQSELDPSSQEKFHKLQFRPTTLSLVQGYVPQTMKHWPHCDNQPLLALWSRQSDERGLLQWYKLDENFCNRPTGLRTQQVETLSPNMFPTVLEKVKRLFENAPLVDVGDKNPFYDNFMAGPGSYTNPEELRLFAQIILAASLLWRDESASNLLEPGFVSIPFGRETPSAQWNPSATVWPPNVYLGCWS